MRKSTLDASASPRPKRVPIHERHVLSVRGKEDGFHYRIVNDIGDRVQQFLDAGYELVDAKDVSIGDRTINRSSAEGSKAQVSVGGGVKGMLMRIPESFYKEDQQAKQDKIKELERSLKNQIASGSADYGKVEITK